MKFILSKEIRQHRITARVESFSVIDRDTMAFDENNERGNTQIFSYRYRINKRLFFQSEYNWIESKPLQ